MLAAYRSMALLRDSATKHLNGVYEQQVACYSVVGDWVEMATTIWTQSLPDPGSKQAAGTTTVRLGSQGGE